MHASSTNWPKAGEASLEVHLLGLVDFDAALFLQDRLVEELSQRTDGHGALLVCEHPPLITMGRTASRAHILCEPEELTARQIDVRWLNRGGGCVVHLPGQLAVYPIVPLARRDMRLVEFRKRLSDAVVGMCRELRVPAWRRPDAPGVWCRCGQLAQFGVAVRERISYHGMFLNVNPRLDALRLAQAQDGTERVTSLSAQRQRLTSMAAVRESIIRHVAEQLGYERFHLYTGHPLLHRTRRAVAYA